jgi:predicted lipoprotein with Yx(FWY)xxD motif
MKKKIAYLAFLSIFSLVLTCCSAPTQKVKLTEVNFSQLNTPAGTILGTQKGYVLYYFGGELTNRLICTLDCLKFWSPFATKTKPKLSSFAKHLNITFFFRKRYGFEFAYNNHPLYVLKSSKPNYVNPVALAEGWSLITLTQAPATTPSQSSQTTQNSSSITQTPSTTLFSTETSNPSSSSVSPSSSPTISNSTTTTTTAPQTTSAQTTTTQSASTTTNSTTTTTTPQTTTTLCQPPLGAGDHDYDNEVPGQNDGDGCSI